MASLEDSEYNSPSSQEEPPPPPTQPVAAQVLASQPVPAPVVPSVSVAAPPAPVPAHPRTMITRSLTQPAAAPRPHVPQRSSTVPRCTACRQSGHNKRSRTCPNHPHYQAPPQQAPQPPVSQPASSSQPLNQPAASTQPDNGNQPSIQPPPINQPQAAPAPPSVVPKQYRALVDLTSSLRLPDTIPPAVRPAYAAKLVERVQAVNTAIEQHASITDIDKAWVHLLTLPHLLATSRGGRRRRTQAILANFKRGSPLPVHNRWQSEAEAAAIAEATRRKLKYIARKIEKGQISAGMSVIKSLGIADTSDPAVQQHIKSLYPSGRKQYTVARDMPLPAQQQQQPLPLVLTEDDTAALIKSLPQGVAAGPFGGRYEYIKESFRSEPTHTLSAFTTLLNHMLLLMD
ncbi:MAG TPA: hypothetical protein V6C97_07715 [Oculatellaceae cyanobacterium]